MKSSRIGTSQCQTPARLRFSLVFKVCLAALGAALVLVAGEASASALVRQDVSIPMDDGVSIAATLYVPDGAPPAGGWPAIVFLHAFSRNRQDMNALAEPSGFVGEDYVVLTFDARGHGDSGGLVSVAGPREIADARAVHAWLAARPDVADARIGAWGMSYGGGIALNSLVAGVPWAAVVAVETWTDLYSALMPQGLVKSGLVAGLASSIPEARRDPELAALQAAAYAGNVAAVRPWAQARSSLSKLGSVTTPVFIAQGRRDFLFGIGQGTTAFQRLRGPKLLYLGLHGHAPSTFPAADTAFLMSQVERWYGCYLLNAGCTADPVVAIAPENFAGTVSPTRALPRTRTTTMALPGVSTFARSGKAVRTSARLRSAIEIFGSPTVTVPVAASRGWSRLVAVLTARTPQGNEILVGAGGVPTKDGSRKMTIRLSSQVLLVPRGSRLTLTLAASSTAQSNANLLYLDLPMPPTARVRAGTAVLRLPALRSPVTK
jgi:predicted acyl esterase